VEEPVCLLGCVLPWPAVAPTRQNKPSVGKAWVRRSLGVEQASSITALVPPPCPTMNSPSLSAAGLCRWIGKRRTCLGLYTILELWGQGQGCWHVSCGCIACG